MCRWLAYAGPPVFLDTLITRPEHSLIDQSLFARQNYVHDAPEMHTFRDDAFPTNGDGFGVGWYGEREVPGRYRDCRPAWNDENLHGLVEQIRSGMFLAHVRATLGGSIQRSNNHPFRSGRWLFQHNGEINGWPTVMRDLRLSLRPDLFPHVGGTTDSETCFLLALTYGLEEDVPRALARMAGRVERARREHGIAEPFRLTCCVADGKTLQAVRYSSDSRSKTLYHSTRIHALREIHADFEKIPDEAAILVSEPFDNLGRHWDAVGEAQLVSVRDGVITEQPFEPIEA